MDILSKLNPDGSINKLKARLVVKRYVQQWSIDFTSTFALIARHNTIRLLIALVAKVGWKIYHLKVKSTFLNCILGEVVYVEQFEKFFGPRQNYYVFKLYKALYELKQVPRVWYSCIDEYLLQHGFERSSNEITLDVKKIKEKVQLIVSLNVDDLFVVSQKTTNLEDFKTSREAVLEMYNFGEMNFFFLNGHPSSKCWNLYFSKELCN